MRRSLPIALALAAMLALTPPATARIVVNVGVDGVKLGDSRSKVRARLGRPTQALKGRNGQARWNYTRRKLVIMFDRRGVHELDTFSTHERTAKGVGPGSTFGAVERAYPGSCQGGVPNCGVSTPITTTLFGAPNGTRVQVVKIYDRRYPT